MRSLEALKAQLCVIHALCTAYAAVCGRSAGRLPVASASTVAAAIGTPRALSGLVLSQGDYATALYGSCLLFLGVIQGRSAARVKACNDGGTAPGSSWRHQTGDLASGMTGYI